MVHRSPDRVSILLTVHEIAPRLTCMQSQLIQAYMTLHSQHSNIVRRLSQDYSRSPSPTMSSPRSSISSTSPYPMATGSPNHRRGSRSSTMSSSSPPSRRSSIEPIPEQPEEESYALAISNDEFKLADISYKIKVTLTDLLNCEGVRNDARMRTWVATRLIDLEHELKDSQRRRSSGTTT